MGTGDYSVGTWGQSVTVGTWGQGRSGGPTACSEWLHQQGVQSIHMYMGQGVQQLTVGTWARCPADSGYIRAGGSS